MTFYLYITLAFPYTFEMLVVALIGGVVIFGPYARRKVSILKEKDLRYAKQRGWTYQELLEERNRKRNRKIPPSIRKQVFERDHHQCRYCGATTALTLDHIFPFSRGGGHEVSNLQVLCQKCNQKKSAVH